MIDTVSWSIIMIYTKLIIYLCRWLENFNVHVHFMKFKFSFQLQKKKGNITIRFVILFLLRDYKKSLLIYTEYIK